MSTGICGVSLAAEQAGSCQHDQAPNKVKGAAKEFEAILLAGWLEKMRGTVVPEGESQDAGHDALTSLGTQAVAGALAARGGIGIAKMIERQLLRR